MPMSHRLSIALVFVVVLIAMLPISRQPLFAQNLLTPTPVNLSLNKKINVSLSLSHPNATMTLKVPVAGDVVVILDSPVFLSFDYLLTFPDGSGFASGGGGGSDYVLPPGPYHRTDLLDAVPANSTLEIELGLEPEVKRQMALTLAVYLVQPQSLSTQSAVAGQVTPGLPVAEYAFDIPRDPLAIRVTGNRTGAFAIVDGHVLKDMAGKDLYDLCNSWQHNAEYEMAFFMSRYRNCRVVVSRADVRGLAQFQIQASAYPPIVLDSTPQTVALSPQNPVMLWTFTQAAGETIELSVKRLSDVALDIEPVSADATRYAFDWKNNQTIIPMSSKKDGTGYVFLMLAKDSQQHVSVQISLKHGIIGDKKM